MTKPLSVLLISAVFGLATLVPGTANAHRDAHRVHVDVVRSLPAGHHRITHRGEHLAYHAGKFYSRRGGHWVVARAPIGAVVPTLPHGVVSFVRGPHRHYRYSGVEYRRTARGYVVVHR